MALHGLEDVVQQAGGPENQREKGRRIRHTTFCVRYADACVVCNHTWEGIQRCTEALQAWRTDLGLALQDTTTRSAHTLEAQEACHGHGGFDFLNGTLRPFPVGKSESTKGDQTIRHPSKHSIAKHWKALTEIMHRMKATTREDVIRMRNPQIVGGCAYGNTAVSSQAFQRLDTLLWHTIDRWATRKHSRKSADWVVQQYCKPDGKSTHGRVAGKTQTLRWHRNTPVTRHVTRRKGVSPYDGTWSSWGTRRGQDLGLESTRGQRLTHQGGRCTHGRLCFTVADTIDIPHADGNHTNRKLTTLRLVHLLCHDLTHGSRTNVHHEHLHGKTYA
jgi:RNA-directed DNA polymerase